jgi:hypothetical protein
VLADVERAGKLTGHDRENAVKDLDAWRAAGGHPPRAGIPTVG